MKKILLSLILTTLLAQPAFAADEWNTTGRSSWGTCARIEYGIDESTVPSGKLAQARQEFQSSFDEVNAKVGYSLLNLLPGSHPDVHGDDIVTIEFSDTGAWAGTAGASMRRRDDGEVVYVDGGINLNKDEWFNYRDDSRNYIFIHEVLHTVGLGHVADVGEVMSYSHNYTHGIGDGTTHALRTLYDAQECGRVVDLESSREWKVPNERSRWNQGTVGGDSDNLQNYAVDVARYTAQTRYDQNWVDTAIICRNDIFADCLAGSGLAGLKGAFFFVPGGPNGAMSSRVYENMKILLRPDAQVYVLGGEAAVSAKVFNKVSQHWNTERVAGDTRYDTALAVANKLPNSDTVLVARGDVPSDATAASSYLAKTRLPLVLTAPDSMSAETRAFIGAKKAIILGGNAAVSQDVEATLPNSERIAGDDRFHTAVLMATRFFGTSPNAVGSVIGTNGQSWALAVAAGPVMARHDGPILYTRNTDVDPHTQDYLMGISGDPADVRKVLGFGSGSWVNRDAYNSFAAYLKVNL